MPPADPVAFLAAARKATPQRVQAPVRRRLAADAEVAIDHDDPMPWRVKAACRFSHPSVFYPQLANTSRWDRTEPEFAEALAFCRVCDVQSDCLIYALERREDDGVWGGTDPFTRRAMLRSMGGRISSGNVPVEAAEPAAEVIVLAPDTEPTDAELAELEADLADEPDFDLVDDLFDPDLDHDDDHELLAS